MKRYLTDLEIQDIIDNVLTEYRTFNTFPNNMRDSILSQITNNLYDQLEKIMIVPEGIPILKEKIAKKYRMVIPGKSVGIICGQSIGEFNTQTTLNSVSYDTKILLKRDDTIFSIQIGPWIDELMGYPETKTETKHFSLDQNIRVPSISEEGVCSWKKVLSVTRHPVINEDGSSDVLRVTTNRKKVVIATKSHSFVTMNQNSKFVKTYGSDLKIESIVPINGKKLCYGNSLEKFFKFFNLRLRNDYNSGKFLAFVSDSLYDHDLNMIIINTSEYIDIDCIRKLNSDHFHYKKYNNTLCIVSASLSYWIKENKCSMEPLLNQSTELLEGYITFVSKYNTESRLEEIQMVYNFWFGVNTEINGGHIKICEHNETNDIHLEYITNIEIIPNPFDYVYDLTVEETKTFSISSGLFMYDTFHKAGLTEKTVVSGVPRFLEIIDTNRSETQTTPSCFIYLNDRPTNISKVREIIGNTLICYTMSDLVQNYHIEEIKYEPEDWYMERIQLDPTQIFCRIVYEMNMKILYRYKITLLQIVEEIRKIAINGYIIGSPMFIGRIDIWFKIDQDTTELIEDTIHQDIMKKHICGIPNIQNIFFMRSQDTNEWYIETDGSNLEKIYNLPYVDIYRTYSNDIWEIYNLFGIEAIREYLIFELSSLMSTIHYNHISLLVDRMTVSGKLRSISRYTRKNESSSVFSKVTFEETLTNFLRASLSSEFDDIVGASASIICGRVPRVGTGMNELVLKNNE